jgi:transcriptional regulator with XRE-family HTH domain
MENNFATNLKHLRIQSGMTQEELAKKLGKDYSTIGKWELGQRSPIMTDVIRISQLFNVSLEKLMCGSFTHNNENVTNSLNNNKKEINFLEQYQLLFDKDDKLTEEQKKFFMDYIEEKHKEIDNEEEKKE